jgi:periplasmic divalent cation tolerance protein
MSRSVVEARLAACAQVLGPITSYYWWRDEVQVDEEYLLLMKTPKAHYTELEAHIHRLHPYEVAEIVSVPLEQGLASYLTWLDLETRSTPAG